MKNEITIDDFTFQISTTIKNNGIQIGLSLKGISEILRESLVEELELKQEAVKYTRHSKKRNSHIKRIKQIKEYLELENVTN